MELRVCEKDDENFRHCQPLRQDGNDAVKPDFLARIEATPREKQRRHRQEVADRNRNVKRERAQRHAKSRDE